MPTDTADCVIRHLRKAVLLCEGEGLTDGQLLERYLTQRDEAAFEALVHRHGPMVLGTCRRILCDSHDAEDAFQATFLVLARKAGSIRPREQVGHWLYGVAYRTALKARSMNAKRRAKERVMKEMPRPDAVAHDTWQDLQPFLDDELHRLPTKYRIPLVMCYLDGKTKKETAQQMGLPEGTVSSRLARGRGMLRQRLARRGLSFSTASLATALSLGAVSASVPQKLVSTTALAALTITEAAATGVVSANVLTLMEGVLQTMFTTRIKIVTVILLAVSFLGVGVGVLTHRALAVQARDKTGVSQKSSPDRKTNGSPKDKRLSTQKKEPKVTGTFHSMDADRHRIILTIAKGDRQVKKTFHLSKEAKMMVDGKSAKPGGFRPGFGITLTLSEDRHVVIRVNAHGPSVIGRVKSIDGAKSTLVMTIKTSQGDKEKSFKISNEVKVSISGKKKSGFIDLKTDSSVSLLLSADKSHVVAISSPAKRVVPHKKKKEPR